MFGNKGSNPNGQQLTVTFPLMFSLLIQGPSLILYVGSDLHLQVWTAAKSRTRSQPRLNRLNICLRQSNVLTHQSNQSHCV